MDTEIRNPSPREGSLLRALLSISFAGRDELAHQLDAITVRSIDTNGSIALRVSANVPSARVRVRTPVEGVWPDEDGTLVHAILHVVDGYLNELELLREDSGNIQRAEVPGDLKLVTFD